MLGCESRIFPEKLTSNMVDVILQRNLMIYSNAVTRFINIMTERQAKRFKLTRCDGFGHVVSDIFLERFFLCLVGSVIAPSLSDRDDSFIDFRPRLMFLSSFSDPSDSRFDFRR